MLLVLGVFTACSGAKDEVNPEILGVKDAAAVEQGKEYDALAGVTATDDKGGDLTAELTAAGGRFEVYDIAQWFGEAFFETKKVVYAPR